MLCLIRTGFAVVTTLAIVSSANLTAIAGPLFPSLPPGAYGTPSGIQVGGVPTAPTPPLQALPSPPCCGSSLPTWVGQGLDAASNFGPVKFLSQNEMIGQGLVTAGATTLAILDPPAGVAIGSAVAIGGAGAAGDWAKWQLGEMSTAEFVKNSTVNALGVIGPAAGAAVIAEQEGSRLAAFLAQDAGKASAAVGAAVQGAISTFNAYEPKPEPGPPAGPAAPPASTVAPQPQSGTDAPADNQGSGGASNAPAQFDPSRFDPAFGGGIGGGPNNIFQNSIWGRNGGSNAALSQLLAMANADLAAGRACLANPEGCSGTLPYSPGQVQTVANQVLKEAGANAVSARAAAQTVNSPSGATSSSTISGLSAQRPGSPTAGQRIATVAPAGSSNGVEPTNSTVHTTVTPQLSSASHGNPNPPSGAAPGANAGGIGSVAARTGSAASSAAARGASSAASSATSQAASAAAANAASRAASNAASRTASAAAANAASRAASAAAANAASRVRIPTVSDIRLKRDIVEVGQLPDGLHLYRYRYLWSDTVYVGVMAQEVLTIAPDAVVRGDDGYLRVDYGRLGLQLTTWDQWTGRGRERATDRQ
jgi:hypothetical protein